MHVAPFGVLSASSVAAEGDPVEQGQRQGQKQRQKQKRRQKLEPNQLQELPLPNPPLHFVQGRELEQKQSQSCSSLALSGASCKVGGDALLRSPVQSLKVFSR
ncbi:hypothetical protein AXG53_16270 [Stenotrophomonas sp. KCTC 12332]|nr:hypothetical protein AXG53_16270 [Stenotrophomonas sp. KCTC 12332]